MHFRLISTPWRSTSANSDRDELMTKVAARWSAFGLA
jgi:hypothetical protein